MNRIIFIHGLSWKPPANVLATRLARHLSENVVLPADSLGVAYWADLVDRETTDPAHDEYTEPNGRFEPLSGRQALRKRVKGKLRSLGVDSLGALLGDFIEHPDSSTQAATSFLAGAALDSVSQRLYAKLLRDIHRYLNGGAREEIKARLEQELQAAPAAGKTCLIAHSMGSMIAADVLASSNLHVDRLLTIGSPLGISVIRRQLGLTEPAGQLKLSQNIGQWVNLYDRLDKVALDHDLADDFPQQPIRDVKVDNEFITKDGERNHHKSYGYLRTPELGQLVTEFLAS